MSKDYNIGTLLGQRLIRPITQAALSSFHSIAGQKQDAIAELKQILSGNFNEIIVRIKCESFDPFQSFCINYYDFSKIVTRDVTSEDKAWWLMLRKKSLIENSEFKGATKVTVLVIEPNCPFNILYLCFHLGLVAGKTKNKTKFYPGQGCQIYISSPDPVGKISNLIYRNARIDKGIAPYDFNLEEFFGQETMTIRVQDCKIDDIVKIKGIEYFEFQNYNKVLKYYGVECLRDMIRTRLASIVDDSKLVNVIADFLTFDGRFVTHDSNDIRQWLNQIYSSSNQEGDADFNIMPEDE